MSRRRYLSLFLIACALLLRVAVPSGWMPIVGHHGALALAPCPAAAPLPMMHGGHHGDHDAHKHDGKMAGDCSFAPHQVGFAQLEAASLLLPAAIEPIAIAPIAIGNSMPTGPPAPPPPATGPPHTRLI